MAESSSVHDTSVRQPLLAIKAQQNLIIDLTPFVYEPYMLYVVECLKYSPLVDTLIKVEVVPMSFLSFVYSTAFYDKANERIHFELHDEKISISKSRFCALIGLSQDQSLLVQSLVSSSRHSEISRGRFWSLITKWAMDRHRVPIMADSLLSSISTFHTKKIIVTDPTKFSFIGPIPEAMLGRISASGNVLQQYRKRTPVGPRELTPAMLRSIEEADKPAKRGKKPETQKEGPVTKPTKGKIPKKRKIDKAATSQPQPKKQKKPARRLIRQSSSDSDSEYVPPTQKNALPSESESEISDEEASGRGDTPPRSPTPEIPVRCFPPSPPPVAIPVSIPPISLITTSQPFTIIPIPTPIFTDTTSTTTTKPTFTVPNPPSEDDDDEPITKHHLKAVNDKLDLLLSSSSSGAYSDAALKALPSSVVAEHSASLSAAAKAIEASTSQYSLRAAAAKNAETVNTSMENLQKTLQSECSNIAAARHAIEEANESFHANFNERLTQLEADLAMENRIMDELDRRTAQLKLQTHKLRTANAKINDLKSEKEVIRSSATNVHSILLRLIEANDPLISITVRRHLADKIRPALDVLSRIEGVLVTGVQPKQGGEKESKQPPPSSSKPVAEPKDNEDDVYVDIPKKPVPKDNTSEKETEEITKKQRAELEQKRKEAELLEKKMSMFPV
ncbi:uncharacterized protein LOC111900726 [Lactuca sativa]|uniref:uncharacterized protein LOC111900726 n=1 Tax=Lactuca sativa TaxID=4236 RepID=UPI000CD996DE|nr:uncharacterized protein LOC111900726 [Lactuca sativa]